MSLKSDDYAGISTGGRVLAVNSQTRTLTLDRESRAILRYHADNWLTEVVIGACRFSPSPTDLR
ncbi:hypothetical protein [Escherichia coli]|uniref:hypothetical protein n=1 Tax=Escherichia coli TaxID=562 RepID=UPI004043D4E6